MRSMVEGAQYSVRMMKWLAAMPLRRPLHRLRRSPSPASRGRNPAARSRRKPGHERGAASGRAHRLAGGDGNLRRPADGVGKELLSEAAAMARVHCGPACRRPPHRAGRVPGTAQLFDRLGTGRRHDRARRREARRRRGLSVLPRGRPARRLHRDARPDRRPLQLGPRRRWPDPSRRRRLRRRAAGLDAPPPRGRRAAGQDGPRLFRANVRRRDLPRRADAARHRRSSDFSLALTLTREAAPLPGQRTGRIDRGFIADVLSRFGGERPRLTFVCGATAFVEVASMFLIEAGLPFASVRTERYGGSPAAELAQTTVAPEV